jgi:hypothetical protein
MSNGTSESESSFRWNYVVLGVAVVALAAMSWAYFEQRNVARTQAAASEESLAAMQAALDEEKAKPITFEYARPDPGDPAFFYVQVQAGKAVRFYNNTETDPDPMVVEFEAGAFKDLTSPFTVEPGKHVDATVDEQALDLKAYWVRTPALDHGGAEMIVGSGP